MFPSQAQPPASYTIVEVRDPAEMDEHSRVSNRLPGRNAAHCYSLRDKAAGRQAKGMLLTRLAMRRAGDLQISHAGDRLGTGIKIVDGGMHAFCFGLIHAGRMGASIPGVRQCQGGDWVEAGPGSGLIHGGQADTKLLTDDGTARTNLWLATSRFESALVSCLHEALRAPLVFLPTIDWTSGPGTRLRLLLAYVEAEFAEPDGLAGNPVSLTTFVDLFVHSVLNLLPHNYNEALSRPEHPAPVHLRRAEAYLEAHADAPLRLEDIAAAAGCSGRTLQRAFRQFRESTPHAAIQAARLDRARAELVRGDASVAAIARRFGFTKPARFIAAYTMRFGCRP